MVRPSIVRGNISGNSNRNSKDHLKLTAICLHDMRETTTIANDKANPREAIARLCKVAMETIRTTNEMILARGSQLWIIESLFEYCSMFIASFPKKILCAPFLSCYVDHGNACDSKQIADSCCDSPGKWHLRIGRLLPKI